MSVRSRFDRVRKAVVSPRGRDVLAVVLALLGWVLSAVESFTPVARPVALVIGAVGVLALVWRRRWPVAVVVVTGVASAVTAVPVPVMLALATLAVRDRGRTLVLATLSVAGAVMVQGLMVGMVPADAAVGGVSTAVVSALGGAYVGARRDLLSSLRDRAERAEAERELRGEQARTAERARIAREMHDVLAHKVSLIALQAGALEVKPDRPVDQVEAAAALIRSTARATLEDLRGVLGVLRSDQDGTAPLAPQPGLSDLERLVQDSVRAGVQVDLRVDLDGRSEDEIGATVGRTAYRVVQESLTNVHKHARGARTAVDLSIDGDTLWARVTNVRPVAAGSLLPGAGVGLTGLRERVELSGGTLESGPLDGGWRVVASLPLRVPDRS